MGESIRIREVALLNTSKIPKPSTFLICGLDSSVVKLLFCNSTDLGSNPARDVIHASWGMPDDDSTIEKRSVCHTAVPSGSKNHSVAQAAVMPTPHMFEKS